VSWGFARQKRRNRILAWKASGRYIVVKNLGVATEEKAIESLRKKGEEWIRLHADPLPMQFGFDEREEARRVLDNIDFVYHDVARISLNQVYHLIGFDEIKDGILRDLVVARICEPASKHAGDAAHVPLHAQAYRCTHLHVLCGPESLQGTGKDM
jgi:hypothetical protein